MDLTVFAIAFTGGNHWVCLSSIGCSSGHVNLYDSFFHDVVCDDIEEQARSLLGQEFRGINVVPIQQQLNGSDRICDSICYEPCFYARPLEYSI